MSSSVRYPRRLIEVDLPIRKISEHARRDQNVRKGHLHSIHVWWATRPLASCRAVTLATMLPDPADEVCPETFRDQAADLLKRFTGRDLSKPLILRETLMTFISDFADWDAGVNATYLEVARKLVTAAHPEGTPIVMDPFAGAGSIPFEALRLGADAFASDLNPIPVLMNKVALEYLPRYGHDLADAVKQWGQWVLDKAREELGKYYPTDAQGDIPHAFYWARQIKCEGPQCGAQVPLLGMLWLSRKKGANYALRYAADPHSKVIDIDVFSPTLAGEVQPGLSNRFSVTCPICNYTTPYKRVREQIRAASGGTLDARHLATSMLSQSGLRSYRTPNEDDAQAFAEAKTALSKLRASVSGSMSLVPDEPYPNWYSGVFNPGLWGIRTWGDLFTERQALTIATFGLLVKDVFKHVRQEKTDDGFAAAVVTCLALAVSKMSIYNSSTCYLHPDFGLKTAFLGTGMAMVGDYAEVNPLMPIYVGGFEYFCKQIFDFLEHESSSLPRSGTVQQASATASPLPDDSVPYVITDPPYYAAVPYSDLSDYCYVWLKRILQDVHPSLTRALLTPKDDELIAYYVQPEERKKKDGRFFEDGMQKALADARRVLAPDGLAVIIFAHKGTAGWEALLNALVNAGWTVTGSWPIDTENRQRWRAAGSATLSSSVHLVCRPRENADGSLRYDEIGDWRSVLRELPTRIHAWMPRLALEGVIGADAIFACLGPALEIFSRYSRVEKASGERVELREYLEHIWAAVAHEALSMIFDDPETADLEEDARLTAMWLWTLSTGVNGWSNGGIASSTETDTAHEGDEDEAVSKATPGTGFSLEYDAARKIAQGLGAHLEDLSRVIAIKGDQARLLSVTERARHLFGKDPTQQVPRRRAKKEQQLSLFEELETAELDAAWGDVGVPPAGETTLDRVHQSMILFAAGRSEALKRFLVIEGIGQDPRFWKLAQSLSALYPNGTEEKRWLDGVLARKKGLGFGK